MTIKYNLFPDADVLTLDGKLMTREERLELERHVGSGQVFENDDGLVWDIACAQEFVARACPTNTYYVGAERREGRFCQSVHGSTARQW